MILLEFENGETWFYLAAIQIIFLLFRQMFVYFHMLTFTFFTDCFWLIDVSDTFNQKCIWMYMIHFRGEWLFNIINLCLHSLFCQRNQKFINENW